jgi:hypothetical protein
MNYQLENSLLNAGYRLDHNNNDYDNMFRKVLVKSALVYLGLYFTLLIIRKPSMHFIFSSKVKLENFPTNWIER